MSPDILQPSQPLSPSLFSDNLDNIAELRISSGTPPKELAACIIHLLNDGKRVRLAAIGHQSVGQAVKSVPIVNQYCVAQGYLVAVLPSFSDVPVQVVNPEEVATVIPGTLSRSEVRTVTMLTLVRISPQ